MGAGLNFVSSVLFSGVVAAVITYALNRRAAKLDNAERNRFHVEQAQTQQQMIEDWEQRKFEANQRLVFFRNLTELFYGFKNELYFFSIDMNNYDGLVRGAERFTEQALVAANPQISAAELASQKVAQTGQQRLDSYHRKLARLDQYNNTVKVILARAEAELSVSSHYLPSELHARVHALLRKLNPDIGTPEQAIVRLKELDLHEVEFRDIQSAILEEVQVLVNRAAGGWPEQASRSL